MNASARRILFGIFGAALLGFLCWGVLGLAPFGHYPGPYGDIINAAAPAERHIQNAVTAIMFDYRGVDTLGEEFILFASVTGVVLLMRREQEHESEACEPHSIRPPASGGIDPRASDATRLFGLGFISIILIFGAYIGLTGHLSLGGGFQAGVIISSAWLTALLAYGSEPFRRFSNQSALEWCEALGAGGYAVIGCAALLAGKPFLTNILPLGQIGQLLSSGTILLINCAVALEVTAGFILLLKEFVRPLEEETPLRNP